MKICNIYRCNQRSAFCSSSVYEKYYLNCPCKECLVGIICVSRCPSRTYIVEKLLVVNLEGIKYEELPPELEDVKRMSVM
jgi:hypothetical protein